MIEVRNNFSSGLDQDSDYYALGQHVFVDSLNITLDSIARNTDKVPSNIVGNRILYYVFPSGTNLAIGAIANPVRNTIISFVYNSNGNHSIIEYNLTSRTSIKVFENLTDSGAVDILGFTQNEKINSANIVNRDEGDLLFFLDSLRRPTFINISLFKSGAYTPVTRQIIDVAKLLSPSPISAVYDNDTTRPSNYLSKKLFRFRYRWIYDDNFKSAYCTISAVPLPVDILDPTFTNTITNNNVISLSVPSGPKNVKAVEINVSIQNSQNVWGLWREAVVFDKAAQNISDDVTFDYSFYNDSTFPAIDPAEADLLFDWVPRTANAQEMPSNSLCYGALFEGYNRTLDPNVTITINTVAAGSGSVVGSLNGVTSVLNLGIVERLRITFFGIPAVGTVVNVYLRTTPGGVQTLVGTYTTVSGDTSTSVAVGIGISYTTIGIMVFSSQSGGQVDGLFSASAYDFDSLAIIPPVTSATKNSIPTWPFRGQRRLGLVYYDAQGRTNGVLYDAGVTFPAYAENGGGQVLLPYINVKIYHVPPIWAYSYQIVFTQDVTPFLYIETVDVKTDTDYVYFDITNLAINQRKNPTTAAVVEWTFQAGDRMELIRRMSDGHVFTGNTYDTGVEGIVDAPIISGVTQTDHTFVKIRKSGSFASEDYSSDFFIIQLYRPTLQEPNDENAPFFECGVEFPIIDPETTARVHGGGTTNQSPDYVTPAETDIYSGDVYFRVRQEYLSESGVGQFNVQDRNFVDFFISAVNNIDGRPLAIEINAKESYFPATVRFSQAYQANTNINGLNRFYPANVEDYDNGYGDIMRLKCRDRLMRVYQKLKIGVVYLFSQIQKNPIGDAVTVVTDKLLNPIQYYQYNGGIGDNAESLCSFNYADYCTGNINGAALRVSNDGVTIISVAYKMNSWATENLPLRTGNYKVYGAYDQKLNNYIMALEQVDLTGGLNVYIQFYLPAIAHTQYSFALNGVPTAGDIVSLDLVDGEGASVTYSYPVVNGDTLTTISNNLLAQINGGVLFTAIILNTFSPNIGLTITPVSVINRPGFTVTPTITLNNLGVLSPAQTLSFSETEEGAEHRPCFESFLSYKPSYMISLGTLLCSFDPATGQLWSHDSTTYNSFYGVDYESSISVVFNGQPYITKQGMSLIQMVNNGGPWDCPEIISQMNTYGTTPQLTNLVTAEFPQREGKYVGAIKRASNSRGGKINGSLIKGQWLSVKFRKQSASTLVTLNMVTLKANESNLNVR